MHKSTEKMSREVSITHFMINARGMLSQARNRDPKLTLKVLNDFEKVFNEAIKLQELSKFQSEIRVINKALSGAKNIARFDPKRGITPELTRTSRSTLEGVDERIKDIEGIIQKRKDDVDAILKSLSKEKELTKGQEGDLKMAEKDLVEAEKTVRIVLDKFKDTKFYKFFEAVSNWITETLTKIKTFLGRAHERRLDVVTRIGRVAERVSEIEGKVDKGNPPEKLREMRKEFGKDKAELMKEVSKMGKSPQIRMSEDYKEAKEAMSELTEALKALEDAVTDAYEPKGGKPQK